MTSSSSLSLTPYRAYTLLAALWVVVVAPYLAKSGFVLAAHVGSPVSPAISQRAFAFLLCASVSTVAVLLTGHYRSLLANAVIFALCALACLDYLGAFTPDGPPGKAIGDVTSLPLVLCLVIKTVERLGGSRADLGLVIRRGRINLRFHVLAAPAFFAVFLATMVVLWLLNHPSVPGPKSASAIPPMGLTYEFVEDAVGNVWSGIWEEVLAISVIAALSAARRPAWEWLVVSALVRTLPHLYMGTLAVGTVFPGLVLALLFYRYRLIWPAIVAHIGYDMAAYLPLTNQQLLATGVISALALVILLTAVPPIPARRSPAMLQAGRTVAAGRRQ